MLAIALVFSMASNISLTDERDAEVEERMAYSTLVTAQSIIAEELWSISTNVMEASIELRNLSMGSDEASEIMVELVASNLYIVNVVTMNASGFIVNAQPEGYSYVIGECVVDHEATMEMMEYGKPVFSDVFSAVEGFDAAVIAYPVFNDHSTMVGSVTALLQTDVMLIDLLSNLISGTPRGLMVEQLDGRILFDTDWSQIGRYTFEDPIYQGSPSLLAFAKNVSAERSGEGVYTIDLGQGAIDKNAIWTSVTLHERSWRVLVYWEA